MTDNEIVKALECCARLNRKCNECPLLNDGAVSAHCISVIRCEALDLIKRQQAEIEKVKSETTKTFAMINCTDCPMPIKQVCERYGDKVDEIIRRINEEGNNGA